MGGLWQCEKDEGEKDEDEEDLHVVQLYRGRRRVFAWQLHVRQAERQEAVQRPRTCTDAADRKRRSV